MPRCYKILSTEIQHTIAALISVYREQHMVLINNLFLYDVHQDPKDMLREHKEREAELFDEVKWLMRHSRHLRRLGNIEIVKEKMAMTLADGDAWVEVRTVRQFEDHTELWLV
ncbi:hypothetical protein ABW19_dt0207847 [Dactylella cylindrospora]|nr:hypothetical protein ABW19_dt0207847 [Dactylella cylindrospora]